MTTSRRINKRRPSLDFGLRLIAERLLINVGLEFPADLKIYAVVQRCGTYYAGARIITIPLWAIVAGAEPVTRPDGRGGPGYVEWYISHELAHAFAPAGSKHGPVFMNWLKKICPAASIHFELNYKPRNAASAGITQRDRQLKEYLS